MLIITVRFVNASPWGSSVITSATLSVHDRDQDSA